MTQDDIKLLIIAVLERNDPRDAFYFEADVTQQVGDLEPRAGRDLHRLFQRALDEGFITGSPSDYGNFTHWCPVLPTAAGMRLCDAWPPVGREHAPGPWQQGMWAQHAVARIREVSEAVDPRDHLRMGLSSTVVGAAAWDIWFDHLLIEAGYLAGRKLERWGLADLRVTTTGERVLAGRAPDALDRAREYMHAGALRDAMIEAVENALSDRLKSLAEHRGIELINGTTEAKLSYLNDQLAGRNHRAYDKPWQKTIAAVLDQRNVYGHANDHAMTKADVSWVIDCVERILYHLPTTAAP